MKPLIFQRLNLSARQLRWRLHTNKSKYSVSKPEPDAMKKITVGIDEGAFVNVLYELMLWIQKSKN
jgi:hypothetical protein